MKHAWDSEPALALLRLDTREWHILLPDAADARYVHTGHLVFMRRGTPTAVRFDAVGMRIIGQPFPVMADVMQAFSTGPNNSAAGQFDVSGSGSLIYAPGGSCQTCAIGLSGLTRAGRSDPPRRRAFPFKARASHGTAGASFIPPWDVNGTSSSMIWPRIPTAR